LITFTQGKNFAAELGTIETTNISCWFRPNPMGKRYIKKFVDGGCRYQSSFHLDKNQFSGFCNGFEIKRLKTPPKQGLRMNLRELNFTLNYSLACLNVSHAAGFSIFQ